MGKEYRRGRSRRGGIGRGGQFYFSFWIQGLIHASQAPHPQGTYRGTKLYESISFVEVYALDSIIQTEVKLDLQQKVGKMLIQEICAPG